MTRTIWYFKIPSIPVSLITAITSSSKSFKQQKKPGKTDMAHKTYEEAGVG